MSVNLVSWAAYALFAGCALFFGWHDRLFDFGARLGAVKALVWLGWLAFLAYSLYCSAHESLFRSVPKIGELYWGRQIMLDLYLGLGLALCVIHLNEGWLAALLWLVPTLLFANLAVLLYFAIHFDEIVAKLLA